ncbi:MAG: hypothetical protein ABIS86_03565 [Streptosporangiaceae bacterium]
MIVVVAVMVALALVGVGGTALVGTLNSQGGKPVSTAGPSVSTQQSTNGSFATVKAVGPSVRMLAKVPVSNTIIYQGRLNQGETRILSQPDVDLTIYDPKSAEVILDGKVVKLDTAKDQVGMNIKDGRVTRTW